MQSVPTEDEFKALDSKVTNLSTSLTSLSGSISSINTKIASLESRLTKLEQTPATDPNLYDDFKYIETFATHQVSSNGKWLPEYNSNGYFKSDGNGLLMQPGGTQLNIFTGSAMIRSTKKFGNFKATLDVTTEAQVYTKDANGNTIVPPGWQATWVIFRHIDKWRHWYVIVGRDQMEVGRKDVDPSITDQATIEKGQNIIWTGGPATPIGTKRKLTIEFIGVTLKIYLDGQLIVTLVDDGNLSCWQWVKDSTGTWVRKYLKLPTASYTAGEFCPYDEGARSRYQTIIIEPK